MSELKLGWSATKFVQGSDGLRATTNAQHVGVGSWLIADLVAQMYGKYLPSYARGRLVDLGCGRAPLMGLYAPLVDTFLLVDWANSYHDNPLLDIIADLNKPLSMPDKSCDTVLMSDVLEHIRCPQELLKELYRILTPRGVLIMNVPFMYGLHEEPYDYFRYTRFCLEYILSESGFRIKVITEYGGGPEAVADIVGKLTMHIPLFGRLLTMGLLRITSYFVRSMPVSLQKKISQKWPLGYFVVAYVPDSELQ